MKIKIVLLTAALFIGLFSPILHGQAKPAKRIVTLAPALTEIVFALGQGHNIVGNTKFCNYPEAAKSITRVGGYFDTNLELLVECNPDVVFLYPENKQKLSFMAKRTTLVSVKHTGLQDLYDSITTIADTLDVAGKGKALVHQIKTGLAVIEKKAETLKQQKVLLIIGRNPDKLSNMFVVGSRDFLNQLLHIAGAANAYTGNINYPTVSMESITAMNPDVIVELSAFNEGIAEEDILKQWEKFSFISAVKNKKIVFVKNSMWLIPGPRVVQIAQAMQKLLE